MRDEFRALVKGWPDDSPAQADERWHKVNDWLMSQPPLRNGQGHQMRVIDGEWGILVSIEQIANQEQPELPAS
jgi:hypothetical protein